MQPTVAIVGASADRNKFGNKSVRAHHDQGYTVYPINPKCEEIEGLTAYATLDSTGIEGGFDRVSLYLPPTVGIKLLESIAAVGCGELWLNPGTESAELIEKAEALGIKTIIGCSIVDLGVSPADYPA